MKAFPRRVKLVCGGCFAETYVTAGGPTHQEDQVDAAHRAHTDTYPICRGAISRVTRTEEISVEEYEQSQRNLLDELNGEDR